jgi:hypothetical protein
MQQRKKKNPTFENPDSKVRRRKPAQASASLWGPHFLLPIQMPIMIAVAFQETAGEH